MGLEIDGEGQAVNGHDRSDAVPDPPTMYGQLLAVDSKLNKAIERLDSLDAKADVQAALLARIAGKLGVGSGESVPPVREELRSLHERDQELEKAVAETRTIVRVGMLENVPRLVKVLGAIAVAAGTLAALAQQIYQAIGK